MNYKMFIERLGQIKKFNLIKQKGNFCLNMFIN